MSAPPFDASVIAPCGMNCGVCSGHLRPKKRCPGCNAGGSDLPTYCATCRMRLCEGRPGRFCFDCADFSCDRLRHQDHRYRARYGMSEVENLEYIRENGLEVFLQDELRRWISDCGVLCVHDGRWYGGRGTEGELSL